MMKSATPGAIERLLNYGKSQTQPMHIRNIIYRTVVKDTGKKEFPLSPESFIAAAVKLGLMAAGTHNAAVFNKDIFITADFLASFVAEYKLALKADVEKRKQRGVKVVEASAEASTQQELKLSGSPAVSSADETLAAEKMRLASNMAKLSDAIEMMIDIEPKLKEITASLMATSL